MIKPSISPQDVVDLLNEALALDPHAITSLISGRALVNMRLADHPGITSMPAPKDIQQLEPRDEEPGTGDYLSPRPGDRVALVGLIGLLNGMFGLDDNGWGPITAAYSGAEPGALIKEFLITPQTKG